MVCHAEGPQGFRAERLVSQPRNVRSEPHSLPPPPPLPPSGRRMEKEQSRRACTQSPGWETHYPQIQQGGWASAKGWALPSKVPRLCLSLYCQNEEHRLQVQET